MAPWMCKWPSLLLYEVMSLSSDLSPPKADSLSLQNKTKKETNQLTDPNLETGSK